MWALDAGSRWPRSPVPNLFDLSRKAERHCRTLAVPGGSARVIRERRRSGGRISVAESLLQQTEGRSIDCSICALLLWNGPGWNACAPQARSLISNRIHMSEIAAIFFRMNHPVRTLPLRLEQRRANNMLPRGRVTFLLLGAFCLSITCFAQVDRSALTGTVRDTSGGTVPGTAILLVHEQTGLERKATSNAAGVYDMPDLPPG